MTLAINFWLRRREQDKVEPTSVDRSNVDAYFPQAFP
jgi:hypothetical protein